MACECAEKAKSQNYLYFAIGFYGECFAGKDSTSIRVSLASAQQVSSQCIRGDFKECESATSAGKHECVGSASHEYIYSIQQQSHSDTTSSELHSLYLFHIQCVQKKGNVLSFP